MKVMASLGCAEAWCSQRYATYVAVVFLLSLPAEAASNVSEYRQDGGVFSGKNSWGAPLKDSLHRLSFVSPNEDAVSGRSTLQNVSRMMNVPIKTTVRANDVVNVDTDRHSIINQTGMVLGDTVTVGEFSTDESMFTPLEEIIRTELNEGPVLHNLKDNLQSSSNCVGTLKVRGNNANAMENKPNVFGGEKTDIEHFPFMASLRKIANYYICSVSVVSSQWMLTAAHCVYEDNGTIIDSHMLFVIAGSPHNDGLRCRKCNETIQLVDEVNVHPDYKRYIYSHDFAMLHGRYKFPFGRYLQPALLPSDELEESFFEVGRKCEVAGWGRETSSIGLHSKPLVSRTDSEPENVLMKVKILLEDRDVCYQAFKNVTPVTRREHLCAAPPEQGVCKGEGDTGGPLICDGLLVGVATFPLGCGDDPTVFVRVDTVMEWVKSSVNDSKKTSINNALPLFAIALLLWSYVARTRENCLFLKQDGATRI